jgi:5S rRNA maturation endonuclease (ribonuclease M5)
MHDDEL